MSRSLIAALCALALSTSAVVPASARISERDRRTGAESHRQILAEFGGVYSGPGAALTERVGRRMAVQSGLSGDGGDCTITLLNTNIVNAFALPGCYIYATRGLLAIMNDEAELASVLGHEIGHVAARHGQKRQNRSILSGIGAIAAAVLTGSNTVGQLAGSLGQRLVLGYSRSQEYEADQLGIRYLRQAGYTPYAAADMLESLQEEERLQARLRGRDEASRVPVWARTHPLTADRVARATKLARETKMAPGEGATNAEAYLAAIDGQLFGDDPAQGIVDGPDFAHPTLRIAFRAPPGFSVQNGTRAVTISGPNGAQAQFAGGALQGGETLDGYVQRVARSLVGSTQVQAGAFQETTVNGVRAAVLPLRANSNRGVVDVNVAAYEVGQGQAFHFVTISLGRADAWAQTLIGSFRRLTPEQAARLRPRVLDVVVVRPGDTVQGLARQMAFRDLPVERFLAINDLTAGQALRPGQRVKLVRFAAR